MASVVLVNGILKRVDRRNDEDGNENSTKKGWHDVPSTSKSGRSSALQKMSLVDPEWEMIDPTPDVFALFLEFNDEFFGGILAGCEVKWSARMTLCAGVCSYEGRGGLCSIRLSKPLLSLRPRSDLVETLLHEMIHAYLFVTANNRDRDGHGEEFQKHMRRINGDAGTNITIYHSFHAEVAVYKTHWWRCEGPCRDRHPFYGWVKRASNRAPGAYDYWWNDHQNSCGGKFVKVKEPEGYNSKGKNKSEVKNMEGEGAGRGEKSPQKSSQPSISTFFTGKGHLLGGKHNDDAFSSQLDVKVAFVKSKSAEINGKKTEEVNIERKDEVPKDVPKSKKRSPSVSRSPSASPKKPKQTSITGFFSGTGHRLGSAKDNRLNGQSGLTEKARGSSPRRSAAGDSDGEVLVLGVFSSSKASSSSVKPHSVGFTSSLPSMVDCPVCTAKVSQDAINAHLDNCLL